MDPDLAWHAEEACSNAWPATRQMLLGGWLLRVAGGTARRNNSVNALRGGPVDPAPVAAACEAVYAAAGQDCLFRVTDLVPAMDAVLVDLGYTAEGHTRTLFGPLQAPAGRSPWPVRLTGGQDPAWETARLAITGGDAAAAQALRQTLAAVLLPCRFAISMEEGRAAAVAFGAVDRGLLVLEAVATDSARRRRGHAAAVVSALMAWAYEGGARGACLQVQADNDAARALYAGLGFTTDLYGYHYRRRALPCP